MAAVTCPNCSTEIPAHFKFCGECGVRLPARKAQDGSVPQAQRDEFRDVTILFADVTGFTALSEKLDAEAVHELMNACFDGLGQIVQAHGGHIDKYIGDSIMALFGAPTAHEDDPVRAAETALEMQAFLTEFAARHKRSDEDAVPFKMRIGLNCGTVVAGAIGAAVRRDYSVMGDAVNIASRLESHAEPGTILASADFKHRVEQQFAFGPAQLLHLKGKERPIEAYVLCGEHAGLDLPVAADADIFVARNRELEDVIRALTSRPHDPAWIELRGPLGIGKTRLAEVALARQHSIRPLAIPSRATTAARPFALMRRILQALRQDLAGLVAPPGSREEFAAALAPVADGLEPYLNAIWYIAAPDALGLVRPDPDPLTFRLTLERGLTVLLGNVGKLQPRRLLFLDAFDVADAETRSFLERARVGSAKAFPAILTTVRGNGLPSPQASCVVDLGGLDNAASRQLIVLLSGSSSLAADVVDDIVRRSAGVPLFIKELVRKVEADIASGHAPSTGGRSAVSALPGSLLGVMLSHLDRLAAPARELLGQCSVQGSEFTRSIASGIWAGRGGDASEVVRLFGDLERRQIISRVLGDAERWAFTQELMQNACYDRMLRRDRRELHKAVAAALVTAAAGEQGVSPELLATHYENAENWLAAAQQNLRAGDRAADIFANTDALARYARVLSALDELAGTTDTGTEIHAFMAHRGAAQVRLRIGDYPALKDHADRMLAVAGSRAGRAEAVRLKAQGFMHGGDLETADKMLIQACELSIDTDTDGDGCGSVTARVAYDHADVCYRLGRNRDAASFIAASRKHCKAGSTDTIRLDILDGRLAHTEGRFEDATALYERAYHAAQQAGSLSEEALTSNCMGNAARDSGRYTQAESHFLRALDVWTRTGNTEAIAGAHNNLANLAISRGDQTNAAYHYGEALSAFEKIGNTAGRSIALMNLAILAIESGDAAAAVNKADVACTLLQVSGNRMLLGLARVIKAEAMIDAVRLDEARCELESVVAEYSEASHPLALAGAYRGTGRIHLANARHDEAISEFERSLALFERLKRVQEAARTEVQLATALRGRGDLQAATAYLQKAKDRFTAIGAIRDLQRAEALLQSISSVAKVQ